MATHGCGTIISSSSSRPKTSQNSKASGKPRRFTNGLRTSGEDSSGNQLAPGVSVVAAMGQALARSAAKAAARAEASRCHARHARRDLRRLPQNLATAAIEATPAHHRSHRLCLAAIAMLLCWCAEVALSRACCARSTQPQRHLLKKWQEAAQASSPARCCTNQYVTQLSRPFVTRVRATRFNALSSKACVVCW